MADKVPTSVRFYRFKNKLKDKTAGLGGESVDISPEALANAEAALSEMSEDYPDWVNQLIDQLDDCRKKCDEDPDNRRTFFEEIKIIAHDMKGQGGTFGYPLISTFSDSLYGFSNITKNISDNHVELIKAHIDSMRAVISNRIKGDGGEIGAELTEGLQQAIQKHRVDR